MKANRTNIYSDPFRLYIMTRHRTPTLAPAAGMEAVAQEQMEESVTDYCGPVVYEDGELWRVNLENGYLNYRGAQGELLDDPVYMLYHRDHLGNNRVTMDSEGGIYQIDHYYPFGLPMGSGYNSAYQRWRFGGKELDRTAGLDLYDFEARAYDPTTARFCSIDSKSEIFTTISGYSYCLNDPLRNIDPTGEVTYVARNASGKFEVTYVDLDGCNDILLEVKNGKIKIGETLTQFSFYDTDTQGWAGTIDPLDYSGIQFLNKIYKKTPGLIDYAYNARKGELYDFKLTNGTGLTLPDKQKTIYRGMPFMETSDGTTIYASARDVGNFVAGYVAGVNGLSWKMTRLGFDVYQTIQSKEPVTEGLSSQAAQLAGYIKGIKEGLNRINIFDFKLKCDDFLYSLLLWF